MEMPLFLKSKDGRLVIMHEKGWLFLEKKEVFELLKELRK